jgi:hypothetical protein
LPVLYKGKPYTQYNDEITLLIKQDRLDEAEKLLRGIIMAVESDKKTSQLFPPLWYYANLANIYRKRQDTQGEIKVLETFVQNNSGARTTLHERLERLSVTRPEKAHGSNP